MPGKFTLKTFFETPRVNDLFFIFSTIQLSDHSFPFPFSLCFPFSQFPIPVNTYDHNTAVVLLPCSDASEEGNEEDDDSDSYEQRRRRTKLSP